MDKISMICLVSLIVTIKGVFHRQEDDLLSPCNLAEEGKEYDVNFTSTLPVNLIQLITIESHLDIIANCSKGSRSCTTEKPDLYNTTITQSNGTVVVSLRIYNASRYRFRNDEILYFRAFFENENTIQQLTCIPKFFRRAYPIVPDFVVSLDGANVTFSTQRIYPRGKCSLSFYFNKSKMNLTQPSVTNTELPGDPLYFTTTCSIAVPKSRLRSGQVDVHVTMYPDINNNEADIQYGTYFNYTFQLNNGVIPAVNHSFIITHGETNKRLTISILSINFSVIFSIVLLALIGLYLQNTGKIKRRKRKTSFPQEFRDGDVYEEVNSFDEVDYNEMNLDNDRRMKSDNGRVDVTVKHDVLEDASQGKDGNHLGNVYNRVIVQDTPWDILGVTFEGSYNRVGQRGTEQDGGSKAFQETVRDDCTAVADDTTKTSNEYVVMKKPVRNHFEYITVQDLLTKYKRDV